MKKLFLLAAVAVLSGCAQADSVAVSNVKALAGRPNVIVILMDDNGYGDFSCLGNPVVKTPAMDRLHDQGVRFADFHVAPMCTPTRGQLLTGLDACHNGATSVCAGRSFIRRGIPTMAEIFHASGYRTAHFGKWHLGDSYQEHPRRPALERFPNGAVVERREVWRNASRRRDWNADLKLPGGSAAV